MRTICVIVVCLVGVYVFFRHLLQHGNALLCAVYLNLVEFNCCIVSVQTATTLARPTNVNYLNLTNDTSTAVDMHDNIILVSVKNVPNKVCGIVNSKTGTYHLTAVYHDCRDKATNHEVGAMETATGDAAATPLEAAEEEEDEQQPDAEEVTTNNDRNKVGSETESTDGDNSDSESAVDTVKCEEESGLDPIIAATGKESEESESKEPKDVHLIIDEATDGCLDNKVQTQSQPQLSEDPIQVTNIHNRDATSVVAPALETIQSAGEAASKILTSPPAEPTEQLQNKPTSNEPIAKPETRSELKIDANVTVTYAATLEELYVPGSEPV